MRRAETVVRNLPSHVMLASWNTILGTDGYSQRCRDFRRCLLDQYDAFDVWGVGVLPC